MSVSLHGSSYDFLKLGKYPKTSIAEIINIETNGCFNFHQTKIARIAIINIIVSHVLIFLVPYFIESKKIPKVTKLNKMRFNEPTPPPPYITPKAAVPVVIDQISQV